MRFTFIAAAAALLTGVQAAPSVPATPIPLPEAARGHTHCGYAIIDHYKAYTEDELYNLVPTPDGWNIRNTLYWIGDEGYATEAMGVCNYVCLEFGDSGSACLTGKPQEGEGGEGGD